MPKQKLSKIDQLVIHQLNTWELDDNPGFCAYIKDVVSGEFKNSYFQLYGRKRGKPKFINFGSDRFSYDFEFSKDAVTFLLDAWKIGGDGAGVKEARDVVSALKEVIAVIEAEIHGDELWHNVE